MASLIQFGYQVNRRTPEVERQIKTGLQANLKAAAMIWHAGVLKELTGERSGRTYRVPGTGSLGKKRITVKTKHPRYKVKQYVRLAKVRSGGVMYNASKPGEAPARRTGTLAQTYRFRVKNFYAEVGSPQKYAVALEKGTSKMAPRPHLAPAYARNRARILKALGKNVI